MNILAFDTSASACSVAISINNEIKALHKIAPMQQAQLLLPMIDELLSTNNLQLKQINAIAFGCGPGSFTGIRIATSVAQGLAFGLETQVIPISSLAAIAQETVDELKWEKMLVAVDARINEIYWGNYAVNQNGLVELIGIEKVSPPEQLSFAESSLIYGVGNAWEVYQNKILLKPHAIDSTRTPNAKAILKLAHAKIASGYTQNPETAVPVYLRDEVAVKSNKR